MDVPQPLSLQDLLTPLRHATDSLCKYNGISLELVLQKLSYLACLSINIYEEIHVTNCTFASIMDPFASFFIYFRADRLNKFSRSLCHGGLSLPRYELSTFRKLVRRVTHFPLSLHLLIYMKCRVVFCSIRLSCGLAFCCLDTYEA